MSARQAPVKRFRGNSCSTAAYALQTTFITSPVVQTDAEYTAVDNPYPAMNDAMLPSVSAQNEALG